MIMKLINRVKDFRQQKNLTQEDLAKLVGVSRKTIISLERYKYIPGLKSLLFRLTLNNCKDE